MAGFDLEWNGPEIVKALEEPFHQANEVLGRAFTKEITSNKWSWPESPSPRDIVDKGQLRDSYDSKRVTISNDPAHDHTWSAGHALAVHEGAVFKGGGTMPARPWTEKPLEDGTLEKAFDKLAKAALGRIQ